MNDQFIISKIINWSLAGNSRSDLISLIKTHSGKKLTNLEVDELIQRSKQVIAESTSVDRQQTIKVHVLLYENLFKYFHAIQNTDGMNRSMQQKEKLLGLIAGNKITITRKTEINITKNVLYDLSRLTTEETIRLKQIEMKMQPEIVVLKPIE